MSYPRGAALWGLALTSLILIGSIAPPRPAALAPDDRIRSDSHNGSRLGRQRQPVPPKATESIRFESNQGQAPSGVDFIARGRGYNLFVSPSESVFVMSGMGGQPRGLFPGPKKRVKESASTIRMSFAGANRRPAVESIDPLPGVSNYLIGSDRGKWRTGIKSFGKVKYAGIYSGVDLVYRQNRGAVQYDFIVAPGVDPTVVAIDFKGADKLTITPGGNLVLLAGSNRLRQPKPVLYQEIGGVRRTITGSYELRSRNRVGFRVGRHDPSSPLVIDPTLVYSTLHGGAKDEVVVDGEHERAGVAVDAAGAAYIAGSTTSPVFPNTEPTKSYGGETDAFVSKFNPDGTLAYFTFLGGSGQDIALAVGVDGANNAYVLGRTRSPDFSVPGDAFGTEGEEFLAKLDPSGSGLLYSTRVGEGADLAVDPSGNAYVAGGTSVDNISGPEGAYQPAIGGRRDAFIAKIGPEGSLAYFTYLGGPETDTARNIALGPGGSAYVTGTTNSENLGSPGAYDATCGSDGRCESAGAPDLLGRQEQSFLAKISPGGAGAADRVFFTYLFDGTTTNQTKVADLAVDVAGAAVLTGSTSWDNLPTKNAAQEHRATGQDAFVTKLNASGSDLIYSTYLGGSDMDVAVSIAADPGGDSYVTGYTASDDFPIKRPIQGVYGGGPCVLPNPNPCHDAFLTKITPQGALEYSSFHGGARADLALAAAVDGGGNAYVGGFSDSADFPLGDSGRGHAGGTCQRVILGEPAPFPCYDAFLVKVADGDSSSPAVASMNPRAGPLSGGTTVIISGTGLSRAGSVTFGTVPADAFVIRSDTEISAITPMRPADSELPLEVDVSVKSGTGSSRTHAGSKFSYGQGAWEVTDAGQPGSSYHAAAPLSDGRVLVSGGCPSRSMAECFASPGADSGKRSRIFDPSTGRFSPAADMNTPRFGHTATLLPTGEVLVVGGGTPTAELYDPGRNLWVPTTSPVNPRFRSHTATLLPGGPVEVCGAHCGNVLVIGGGAAKNFCDTPACGYEDATAELYDPFSRKWEPASASGSPRSAHTATLLPNGKVLAVGGYGGRGYRDVTGNVSAPPQVYDPLTNLWTSTENDGIVGFRFNHSATLIQGPASGCAASCNKVLVTGGQPSDGNSIATHSTVIYDSVGNRWTPGPSLLPQADARRLHVAVPLSNGRVLVAGGVQGNNRLATSRVFDPSTDPPLWTSGGSMLRSRGGPPATLNQDTGGQVATPPPLFTATVLPVSNSLSCGLTCNPVVPALPQKECGVNCGKVLFVGGTRGEGAELYTPSPTLLAIAPAAAPVGAKVVLTGTGFTNRLRKVFFGSTLASFDSVKVESYSQLTVDVPALGLGGPVDVSIVTEGGLSNSVPFRALPTPISAPDNDGKGDGTGSPSGGSGGPIVTPPEGSVTTGVSPGTGGPGTTSVPRPGLPVVLGPGSPVAPGLAPLPVSAPGGVPAPGAQAPLESTAGFAPGAALSAGPPWVGALGDQEESPQVAPRYSMIDRGQSGLTPGAFGATVGLLGLLLCMILIGDSLGNLEIRLGEVPWTGRPRPKVKTAYY